MKWDLQTFWISGSVWTNSDIKCDERKIWSIFRTRVSIKRKLTQEYIIWDDVAFFFFKKWICLTFGAVTGEFTVKVNRNWSIRESIADNTYIRKYYQLQSEQIRFWVDFLNLFCDEYSIRKTKFCFRLRFREYRFLDNSLK
jgi:hypothetical protein